MAIASFSGSISLTRCQGQMALRARLCSADLDVPRSPVFTEVLYCCYTMFFLQLFACCLFSN